MVLLGANQAALFLFRKAGESSTGPPLDPTAAKSLSTGESGSQMSRLAVAACMLSF